MAFQKTRAVASTPKGADTRARILAAAARLFAVHGFTGTSFAMIGAACGVATGSIVHCFPDKAGLAGAVYRLALDRLAAFLARAIGRYPADVPGTIDALVSACFAWAAACPDDPVLIGRLAEHAGASAAAAQNVAVQEMDGPQTRLEPLLEAWAQPLIRAGLVQPLTPAQLYAVIIAPALCAVLAQPAIADRPETLLIGWKTVLATAARAAVQAASPKSRPPRIASRKARLVPAKPGSPVPPGQTRLL
jgi:AcrR family transcriptional regulator